MMCEITIELDTEGATEHLQDFEKLLRHNEMKWDPILRSGAFVTYNVEQRELEKVRSLLRIASKCSLSIDKYDND